MEAKLREQGKSTTQAAQERAARPLIEIQRKQARCYDGGWQNSGLPIREPYAAPHLP